MALYKIPNKWPLKIIPLQNPGSLQNPKQRSLKCTPKKYPKNLYKITNASQMHTVLLPQSIPLQNPKPSGHAHHDFPLQNANP